MKKANVSVRKEKDKDIYTIILWNTYAAIKEKKIQIYVRLWKMTASIEKQIIAVKIHGGALIAYG
jgi:hypothetical protein